MKDKEYKKNCRICGFCDWSVLYSGLIRVGRFGNLSRSNHIVHKCGHCKSGYLDQPALNYELSDYRDMVKVSSPSVQEDALYEVEKMEKFNVLGKNRTVGKIVADIGCADGSFLDLIKKQAKATLAVEPCKTLHAGLKDNGHNVYTYCHNAFKDWAGLVDTAVSFTVLEHIEDPLSFLKEIRVLLKKNGVLVLSTPNYDNWLIGFLPHSYASFFYRYVHRWYFNKESLRFIGAAAGFRKTEIKFVQRFDISNAMLWARDNRPTGLSKTKLLIGLDNQYRHFLEDNGYSDFVYAAMHA